MGIYHGNDLRKITGGIKGRHVKTKRKYLSGRYPILTVPGQATEVKVVKARGNTYKLKVKVASEVNVYIPKEGKTVRAQIIKVLDNPSNKDFARRGIISKGAILQTSVGKVKVTSRPGQDGVVNGVLVE
ncbi:30S ribosomal protein S8e [Thermofilum pendens]|uniref:Small ribosomal subunit protein eS8 n=1 Tax=Thermofilum pendens (strain DSM 2475 / Hrk 5) TaxID=368408 RepID=A1RX37_THEPD|nr:30S ribosomal protein S8e [Thermofilum pendens]ABL77767.1 SSU ribosomal protein S8E [Thermofilum pendens Hrk 5]